MNANAGRTDVSAMLADLPTVGPEVLETLHARLENAADRDAILVLDDKTWD